MRSRSHEDHTTQRRLDINFRPLTRHSIDRIGVGTENCRPVVLYGPSASGFMKTPRMPAYLINSTASSHILSAIASMYLLKPARFGVSLLKKLDCPEERKTNVFFSFQSFFLNTLPPRTIMEKKMLCRRCSLVRWWMRLVWSTK